MTENWRLAVVPAGMVCGSTRTVRFGETSVKVTLSGCFPRLATFASSPEDSPCRPLLQADVRAADVYSALTERKLYDGSDLTCNPFFLQV